VIFPDYTKTQRDKFLKALVKATPAGPPLVRLEFRNQDQFSADNQSLAVVKGTVPNQLGPLPNTGDNQMEIRGVVSFHRPDAEYRFNRIIVQKSWYLAGKNWKLLHPPFKGRDNTHPDDEDDHPDNDHIDSVDAPGFTGTVANPVFLGNLRKAERDSVTEGVYMISATESVEVKVGGSPWKRVDQLDWFSVTWLEKVSGTWRRKANLNRIDAGSLIGLEDKDTTPDMVAMPP